MPMWLAIGSLVLGASLMIGGLPRAAMAAPTEPTGQTFVIVAEDKTIAADCQVWVDRPENHVPCDLGTAIFARKTTYAEVKRAGITDYAVLTNDPQKNKVLQDTLVGKVHEPVRPKRSQTLACTAGWKQASGSYLSIPSNPNSARISYLVRYTVQADCRVTGVSDLARISAGELQWLQSCSKGTGNCSARGFNMTVNWSAAQAMFDTTVGAEYRHLSAAPCWNCGMPYGIHHFW